MKNGKRFNYSFLIIGEFCLLYSGIWILFQGYMMSGLCCIASWIVAVPIIIITFIIIKKKKIYDSYFFKLYFSIFLVGIIVIAAGFVYIGNYSVKYKFRIEIIPNNTNEYEIILPLPLDYNDNSIFLDFEKKNTNYKVVSTEYGKGINIRNDKKVLLESKGFKGDMNFNDLSMLNHSELGLSYYWTYANFSDENNSLDINIICEDLANISEKTVKIDIELTKSGWQLIKGRMSHWIE